MKISRVLIDKPRHPRILNQTEILKCRFYEERKIGVAEEKPTRRRG